MGEREKQDRRIGRVTVLGGERGGKYPHGNSLLIEGQNETIIVDPSLAVIPRKAGLPRVDRVLNSHCHEDHIAGNFLFPDASWHLHTLDHPGILSLDGLMAIYGYPEHILTPFRKIVVDEFHFTPRSDAVAFNDGDVFALGGSRLRVIHAPGHTRGHCLFHIEPEDVLYLGDIDLSSFGPYYGDAWSDLEDFERSLELARGIEAKWYATFHHIGVLEGRAAFLEKLDRYAAVIRSREERLLEYSSEPRTLEEIARHRFVYRQGDAVAFAEAVEARSMGMHLGRLIRAGRVTEEERGRFRVGK